MTLEPGSVDIVQLAWARRLGFDDGAFAAAAGERITRADEAARSVQFVRLFGNSALVGPQWALDAAAGSSDEELAQHVTLLTITRGPRRPRARRRRAVLRRRPPPAAALRGADRLARQSGSDRTGSRSARPMTSTRWASRTSSTASPSCIWKTAAGPRWPAAPTRNGKGILAHMGVLVAPGVAPPRAGLSWQPP